VRGSGARRRLADIRSMDQYLTWLDRRDTPARIVFGSTLKWFAAAVALGLVLTVAFSVA
jgi:hypothetical protein